MILTTWHEGLQNLYYVDRKIFLIQDYNGVVLKRLEDVEIQQLPKLVLKGLNND